MPTYRKGPGINKSIARSRVLNLHFFPSPKQAAWNEVSFTLHDWHVPNLKLPRCPTPNLTTSALKFQVFDRVPGHSKVLRCYHLDARLPCMIVSSFSVPLICAQSQILTSACHPGNPISSSCLSRRLCLRLWLCTTSSAW